MTLPSASSSSASLSEVAGSEPPLSEAQGRKAQGSKASAETDGNGASGAGTPNAGESREQTARQVFISTFITIFLAELGDKTQVTTLLMSAESQQPWIVFAGAGTALIATSLLGVMLGRWLARWLAPKTLQVSAGMTLLAIAAWLLWDIFGDVLAG